jgi:hypothetical protein
VGGTPMNELEGVIEMGVFSGVIIGERAGAGRDG